MVVTQLVFTCSNNRNTRERYEICSNFTMKTLERCRLRRPFSSVSFVNFGQVNVTWGGSLAYFIFLISRY